VVAQLLPQGAFDLVQVLVDAVEGLVLLKERCGGLLPHARHAGHVVRGVAREGKKVQKLSGRQAVLLLHRRRVVTHAPGLVEHRHRAPHQLQGVLVRGDDHNRPIFLGAPVGQGGDQVVGFVAGQDRLGQPPGLHQVPRQGQLKPQRVLDGFSVGLVIGVGLVTEGGAGRIETDDQPRGFFLFEDFQEHAGETVEGADGLAAGIVQRREGVVRPVQVTVGVNENEGTAFGGHGG
jgi:hypothetical protein